MQKRLIILTILILTAGLTVQAYKGPAVDRSGLEPGVDYVPGEVLVKLVPELKNQNPAELLREFKMGLIREKPVMGWHLLAVPDIKSDSVPLIVDLLNNDPRVERATPNYIRKLEAWTPNDFFYTEGHLWNLDIIGMPDAWDLDDSAPQYGGDPDVVVAVIDSGIAYKTRTDTTSYPGQTVEFLQVPDLSETNFWVNEGEIPDNGIDDDANGFIDDRDGWNWANANGYPCDDNEHGTHVTGTIAQSTNNDPGDALSEFSAAGMAFNCTIMPLKSGGMDGTSVMADVAEAIIYATDNGAHVVNMSLGSGYVGASGPGNVEYDACIYAADHGVIICSSTGNDADSFMWNPSFSGIGYPAGYKTVIAVGASNNRMTTGDPSTEFQSAFSQYGAGAEVLAPSGDFSSTDFDGSGKIDQTWQQTIKSRNFPDLTQYKIKGFVGTSMACPHVTGQVALILSYANQMGWTLTAKDVRNKLNASSVELNASEYPGYDYNDGYGRINVPLSMTIDPEPELVVRKASVFEGTGQGNGNNRPEADETVSMNVNLMAQFADVSNVSATITSSDPYITIQNGSISYPDSVSHDWIMPDSPVTFSISSNCPLQYEAEFQAVLSCSQQADLTSTFHAKVTPANILFWKDDRYQGKTNFPETPLLDALTNAGIPFEFFDTTAKYNEETTEQFVYPWEELTFLTLPTYDDFKRYDVVIWYAGEQGQNVKQLVQTVLPNLKQYMDEGGGLLLTGHEILYRMIQPPANTGDVFRLNPDAQPNPEDNKEYCEHFVYNYLHLDAVEHDNWYQHVYGADADPLTYGADQDLDTYVYNTTKDYNWWPDNLVPQKDAVVTMVSGPPVRPLDDYGEDLVNSYSTDLPCKMDSRACGIRWEGDYRMVMLAFPLESMSNPGEVFVPLVNWLDTGAGLTSSDIMVDVDTTMKMHAYNSDLDEPYSDAFDLYGYIFNPGSPVQAQRWVLMQIFDEFWCWPSWGSLDAGYDYEDVTIPSGMSRDDFLEFDWPQGDFGSFDGIMFWFAHLQGGELLGAYDFCQTGYYVPVPDTK